MAQLAVKLELLYSLEDSNSCGELRPSTEAFFCPSGKKQAYYAVLALFWRVLVFSSNRGNT